MAGDPDAISRQIEDTRAELAETIDAIADRLSPRRAASRGVAKVRGALHREPPGPTPVSVLDTRRQVAIEGPPPAGAEQIAEVSEHGGAAYTGTSVFAVERRVRPDRVLMAVGVVAGTAAVVIWLRHRRG